MADDAKWQEIARQLRARLSDANHPDHIAVGEHLPSVGALAAELGVASSTVRRAYEDLVRDNVIGKSGRTERYRALSGRRASRTLLTINLSQEEGRRPSGEPHELDAYRAAVLAQGLVPIVEGPDVSIADPSDQDRLDLALPDGEQFVRRAVRRYFAHPPGPGTGEDAITSKDAPSPYDLDTRQAGSLQRTFYPDSIVDRAPRLQSVRDIAEGTIKYLKTQGLEQVGYLDTVTARNATLDEAVFFTMTNPEPVLEIRRIAYTADGTRLRLTQTVFDSVRHRVTYETASRPD